MTHYNHPGYEYMEAEVEETIAKSANLWADQGWETIAVVPPMGLSVTWVLILKRVKPIKLPQYVVIEPLYDSEEFNKPLWRRIIDWFRT